MKLLIVLVTLISSLSFGYTQAPNRQEYYSKIVNSLATNGIGVVCGFTNVENESKSTLGDIHYNLSRVRTQSRLKLEVVSSNIEESRGETSTQICLTLKVTQ